MATNIILLHYNNYFNRIAKLAGNTAQDYTTLDSKYSTITSVNFNPNDNVTTSMILGKGEIPVSGQELDSYDYLLVINADDVNYPVLSRWFIIERVRTRDGQYQFDLKRDVIADYYEQVLNAPCYVEKGIINDINNPLLCNPESISVNQIKKSETPIIDESGCS